MELALNHLVPESLDYIHTAEGLDDMHRDRAQGRWLVLTGTGNEGLGFRVEGWRVEGGGWRVDGSQDIRRDADKKVLGRCVARPEAVPL